MCLRVELKGQIQHIGKIGSLPTLSLQMLYVSTQLLKEELLFYYLVLIFKQTKNVYVKIVLVKCIIEYGKYLKL